MATLLLIRHGRTTANAGGLLAGRTPGVELDEIGRRQVRATGERLAGVRLAGIVTSPLERCVQTAQAILAQQPVDGADGLELGLEFDDRLLECDYGDWQGNALKTLSADPLWATVQAQPSAVVFPGGESMAGMQARAVAAVREHDAAVEAAHGHEAVWAAVSHGDIIKAVLADALGMHLDLFQRISVGPASVSVVRYGPKRPDVVAMNTEAGPLDWLTASSPGPEEVVGGGDIARPQTAARP
ncbi:MSMEG_4193 family putative phosphomutase [Herbiconiux moechotypicola]|uniref:Histidine phosphatase family protein n=1 Tax=Herbiconiux moechotypicola TaxID=637393 RepID=A0ABN3DLI5_9MICO|nr:histidine phosphatase family protein [Herbiconiux moechotypicola]MCS5730140.1 MSMEG_4193 family putative phosphomutase [Herbiconiux moechotypicola]